MRRNYAVSLREFGEFEESLKHLRVAQSMRPDDAMISWEISLCLLYLGKMQEGWDAFETRWKHPNMRPRSFTAPLWRGQDLKNKTILLHEEQGFGDTILCSRYIPMLKERGAKVILECKEPLHRLLQTIPGLDVVTIPGKNEHTFDYHSPMMSLPGAFKTDISSIPAPASFSASFTVPEKAMQLLGLAKGRLKVGIVWSGSVTFANNRRRAVEISRFLSLAAVPGIQLYSLQKGPREKDLKEIGADGIIIDLSSSLSDFADTAAILKELDLVIMTDSSVAHLAGSLGVPVWNLLSYTSYWLYLTDRNDSPWYPSMRLFRQPEPGDWDSVFEEVAVELKNQQL